MKFFHLKDLCDEIIDCPHSTPEWKDSGYRVVRNFNLRDGNLDFSDGYYVDEQTYLERIKRAAPEENDIIISREAPMGVVAIVPRGLKCCLGQRLVLLKVNKEKCNPFYLLHTLMSDYVQTQFKRADATGSIVSNLCIPDLKEIIIPVIEQGQEKVAHLLEILGRKTLLNNRINDNLEQMAFDTYMHHFFKKSPNGTLGEIIEENAKSTVQVGEAKEQSGNYPFFTSGDTILEWDSGMVDGRNCYLNTGGNAGVKFYIGQAAYSTDTWCITAKNDLADYLYLSLKSLLPELNKKFFQGTGLKHLQKPLLKDRILYIPSETETKDFNVQVQPMFDMISANIRENQDLIRLRDWLLPMLMNGQATVSD